MKICSAQHKKYSRKITAIKNICRRFAPSIYSVYTNYSTGKKSLQINFDLVNYFHIFAQIDGNYKNMPLFYAKPNHFYLFLSPQIPKHVVHNPKK